METQTPKRRGPRTKPAQYFLDKYAGVCLAYSTTDATLTEIAKANGIASRQRVYQIIAAAGVTRQVKQPKGGAE